MHRETDAQVHALKALGHYNAAAVHTVKDRWYVTCECGYRSATRTTLRLAVEAIQHHRRLVLAELRHAGLDVPHSRASA